MVAKTGRLRGPFLAAAAYRSLTGKRRCHEIRCGTAISATAIRDREMARTLRYGPLIVP
jgi:hypothetical protein